MPLPSTNISSLSDAGPYDVKDKLQLQRNVLGSWQDFHTNIETYFGPILTVTFTWDGTDLWSDLISIPGKILVPIEVYAVFTPGVAPTGQLAQIVVAQVGVFPAEDTALYQVLTHGPVTNPVASTDILLSANIAGASPFSGTTVITILYVAKDPI